MFTVTRSFKATAFKLAHAVIAAAFVAGVFTAATTGGSDNIVMSSAIATPVQSTAKTCDGTWPYLNCGQAGDQAIRVIR